MTAKDEVLARIAKKQEFYNEIVGIYNRYLDDAYKLAQFHIEDTLKVLRDLGLKIEVIPSQEVYGEKSILRNKYQFKVGFSSYLLKFVDICKSRKDDVLAILVALRSEKNKGMHLVFEFQYQLTSDGNIGKFFRKRLFSTFNRNKKIKEISWNEDTFYRQLELLLTLG